MNFICNLAFLLLFQFLFACNKLLEFKASSPVSDSKHEQKREKAGTANIVFKSSDGGQTWQDISKASSEIERTASGSNIVKSEGVIIATGQKGIRRSTDNGENWEWVISEGGVGIVVEQIKGGFAAITYNTASKTRRVRTSYDGGKTWQPIDAGLPATPSNASIIQVGENFFCGHPAGIFRSADKGKTWKLLLPSVEDKVFNLYVSGNVIYAIPRSAGC